MSYLFDIFIIALLAFYAWRGAAKGLVLSLCGLITVFVAFFGARFISEQFYEPVSTIIRPLIAQALHEVEPATVGSAQAAYSLEDMLFNLQQADLFSGFFNFLSDAVANHAIDASGASSLADAMASYLAKGIARAVLFALSYLAILLAWFLASHALDLAFQLPGLAQVNLAGGLILGLVKGVLLIVVLVWLGQLAGWVPAEPASPVLSLFTVDRLWELLHELPA